MLTEAYIEALLVDEGLADQVWELWNAEVMDDQPASILWLLIACQKQILEGGGLIPSKSFRLSLGSYDV